MIQGKDIQLSVLLATRNNANVLRELLSRLGSCVAPRSWEIVIVDNGSTDSTAALVKEYAERLPVRYFFEGRQGKSRALNRGLKHARGEVVVFTDDDINPDADWLVNIVRVMQSHPDINVLGGKIRVDKRLLPAWLVNSYNLMGILLSEHDLGNREMRYQAGKYPYGPNLSVRSRQLAGLNNPWPEDVGPGTSLPLGDEFIFITNINADSQDCLYSPECIVDHKPVIHGNYFPLAFRRCFFGGYAAGFFGNYPAVDKTVDTFQGLMKKRIASCRSVREFCCILARATGFFYGKYRRKFV